MQNLISFPCYKPPDSQYRAILSKIFISIQLHRGRACKWSEFPLLSTSRRAVGLQSWGQFSVLYSPGQAVLDNSEGKLPLLSITRYKCFAIFSRVSYAVHLKAGIFIQSWVKLLCYPTPERQYEAVLGQVSCAFLLVVCSVMQYWVRFPLL